MSQNEWQIGKLNCETQEHFCASNFHIDHNFNDFWRKFTNIRVTIYLFNNTGLYFNLRTYVNRESILPTDVYDLPLGYTLLISIYNPEYNANLTQTDL